MEKTTKSASQGCASFARQISYVDDEGIVEHVPGDVFGRAIWEKSPNVAMPKMDWGCLTLPSVYVEILASGAAKA